MHLSVHNRSCRSSPAGLSPPVWRFAYVVFCLLVLLLVWHSAGAALPQAPNAPGGGAGGSDFLGFFQGYAGKAIATIILIVGAVIFVVVAWLAIQSLMEAVNGRGSWAGVIILGLVGSGVLVFDLFLLNTASTVFTGVT
jgi:integrating conjugative element membrane protein (TIGR03745 family)